MKKSLNIASVLVTFLALNAGLYGGLKVDEYGIKFGLNRSYFTKNSYVKEGDFKAIVGSTMGGFFSVKFGNKLFSQTEIYYTERGCDISNGSKRYHYQLQYLEFAHLIRKDHRINKTLTRSWYIGPYNSILLRMQGRSISNNGLLNSAIHVNPIKWDFGLILGGSLVISGESGRLWLDFRYQLGMGQVFHHNFKQIRDTGLQSADSKIEHIANASMSMLLGFAFK